MYRFIAVGMAPPDRCAAKLPPKALNNRLAALPSGVMQADASPARPMYDVFLELSAAVPEQIRHSTP